MILQLSERHLSLISRRGYLIFTNERTKQNVNVGRACSLWMVESNETKDSLEVLAMSL
jgi:hypothetical protein